MYQDNGLGFWSSLFKIVSAVGPTLLSTGVQYSLAKRQADQQASIQRAMMAQQAAQPPQANIARRSAAARATPNLVPIPAPELLPGVPNIVLYGGAALLVLVLVMRKD